MGHIREFFNSFISAAEFTLFFVRINYDIAEISSRFVICEAFPACPLAPWRGERRVCPLPCVFCPRQRQRYGQFSLMTQGRFCRGARGTLFSVNLYLHFCVSRGAFCLLRLTYGLSPYPVCLRTSPDRRRASQGNQTHIL